MVVEILVSIPQAVSTIAIDHLHYSNDKALEGFNTASGKYYCNSSIFPIGSYAVPGPVSIPQAVSTIAMFQKLEQEGVEVSFNTASGKYYCNWSIGHNLHHCDGVVSIPQAVSTIAILLHMQGERAETSGVGFNTASGKYYCNWSMSPTKPEQAVFQYRKR